MCGLPNRAAVWDRVLLNERPANKSKSYNDHSLIIAMTRNVEPRPDDGTSSPTLNEAQSPYKADVWRQLTPRERLRRSWLMRSRLPDLKAVHDRKLFPKP